MAQLYAGKRPISKGMGGLYGGLWCKAVIGSRERCASSFPEPLVPMHDLELAPLRHADLLSKCLSIGKDRKGAAHTQNDVIDPIPTSGLISDSFRTLSAHPERVGAHR